jgi:dipeptidase E
MTNDKPICWPPDLNALGLMPHLINPHFMDKNPPGYSRETDEMRICDYHREKSRAVIGLREASMLYVVDNAIQLKGPLSARIFIKGREPMECAPNSSLSLFIDKHKDA